MFDFKTIVANGKTKAKDAGKAAMEHGGAALLVTGGVIVSHHMLDFKKLFKNADPNAWYMKHEGALKFGVGIGALTMFGHKMQPWQKWLLIGVAVHGAIKAARQYTTNAQGVAMFDPIGARNATDEEMMQAAQEVARMANQNSNVAGLLDTTNSSVAAVPMWAMNTGMPLMAAA